MSWRFPQEKQECTVEKQQYMNKYPLKVNPAIVQVPVGIVLRFEGLSLGTS